MERGSNEGRDSNSSRNRLTQRKRDLELEEGRVIKGEKEIERNSCTVKKGIARRGDRERERD